MEKIVNIQNVDPNTLQLQNYSVEDESLISNFTEQDIVFDPTEDYIEYFIIDLNQNILFSNVAGYPNYRLRDNLVTIDPQNDLELQGYTEGQYYTIYNFLKRKLSSSSQLFC
jgi:ABC-type proline/glycine betaine transport system ATPase subunit